MERHSVAEKPPGQRRTRHHLVFPPSLVLVGASTGGPQALIAFLSELAPAVPGLSLCVTLHMPPDLVPVIAAHVARTCRLQTAVVTEPRPLAKGVVHFAPGDRHIEFERADAGVAITLSALRTRDFCKPAVDVMFAAGARTHGPRVLGIILSGMGTDGLAGARALVDAGAMVLVQDKGTSAVWGMPGAISKANLAAAVLPPDAIARDVIARMRVATRSA